MRSVAVHVRVRPNGDAVVPCGGGVACGGSTFGFPVSVIEGSDQATATTAVLSDLLSKFVSGGTSCTLMAYGQTGSGKTYTMFGPTGSLTEASLEQSAGRVPELWGAFPVAMMELLSAPELAGASFHASAIEVYMEHAYDLLDGRKPLKVGTSKGSGRGNLVVGDIGKGPMLSGDVVIVGGVHPSGCSCFHCFQKTGGLVGKKKAAAAADGGRKPGVPRRSKAPPSTSGAREGAAASGAGAGAGAGGGGEFGTEGEALWPLRTPADVARLARLVARAARTACCACSARWWRRAAGRGRAASCSSTSRGQSASPRPRWRARGSRRRPTSTNRSRRSAASSTSCASGART